jgi:small subunit ribosomal protein S17
MLGFKQGILRVNGALGRKLAPAGPSRFPKQWLSSGTGESKSMSEMQQEYAKEISDIMESYEERKKRKQSLVGIITSTKCDKSITIQVEHEKYYPKYNKYIRSRKKIMAHDDQGIGKLGDMVRIVPCRPVSKKKRHTLIDVIKAAEL